MRSARAARRRIRAGPHRRRGDRRTTRELRVNLPAGGGDVLSGLPAAWNVTVLEAPAEGVLACAKSVLFALSEWLVAAGATRVSIAQADYVFSATNALMERLESRRLG